MRLIGLRGVGIGFGGDPLLAGVDLEIARGERVCLVGANGVGKSTLLAIVAGDLAPDEGAVERTPGVRVGALPQALPRDVAGSVAEVVGAGVADVARLVDAHARHAASARDARALADLDDIERSIEAAGGWDPQRRVERILARLGLDPDAPFAALSGGRQRRVLLARALVGAPDLLLLDEPTNHLDLDAIEWLEGLVAGWRGAVLFTTHDRRLVEHAATRIVELDRATLTSWPGDWTNYLRRREERLAAERVASARFERRLAEEEAWIRQGIRARRTRDEGRVRRLEAMRRERAARRDAGARARFAAPLAPDSGRRVVEARAAGFAWGGAAPVVADLDLLVERGDRVGVVGPNGSGKTTLLRLLVGELAPTTGEVVLGTRLEIAYFDQHRAALDPDATVAECVADGTDHVTVGGARRHVVGYLRDFLFGPDRARQPVRALSGGERARLLLARLFAQPSNLLVMDEPTNDLDVETLELLEERLGEYPGTLLVVSHDRAFLDGVVTSVLALEGAGKVGEYVGGYRDWLRQRAPAAPAPARTAGRAPRAAPAPTAERAAPGRRRLGYREQRELADLPERIEALEARVEALQGRLADPALYREEGERVAEVRETLAGLEADLEAAYARWAELET